MNSSDGLRICELVRRKVGLGARGQDLQGLLQWTRERAHALGLPGIEQYGELLTEDGAAGSRERELLTARFSTGESHFFRDHGQFDLLETTILPALIENRAEQRRLRMWSAGCATGEEAYSLAMLVLELAPRLAGWDVTILGTDINGDALDKARLGLYGDWSFRSLDAERKQRYFQPSGKQWQIDQRLRQMVKFCRGDLVNDRCPDEAAGLTDFDLILCRNVFIYLDAAAVGRIVAKFAAALADGGYLITAHSELFGHDTAPLRLRMFAQSAAFEKSARAAAEPAVRQSPALAAQGPQPVIGGAADSAQQRRRVPVQTCSTAAQDCDGLMDAAWQHADRGMMAKAKEECLEAIALAALDPRPYYLLAQLAQESGDTLGAKALLQKLTYLDPSCIAGYLELGDLFAQSGDDARARRMYGNARAALKKLPAKAKVEHYGEASAAEILAYVERLLGAMAGQAEAGAQLAAQSQ